MGMKRTPPIFKLPWIYIGFGIMAQVYAGFELPVMVVGGNFTLGGRPSQLAQYDPKLKLWVDQFEPHLFVYGATYGTLSNIITNRSGEFDELYLMGTFDTTCRTCQAQYCSVGRWAGGDLHPVGEGLCSNRRSPITQINAMEMAEEGDLYVGGTFQSSVWNGSDFVTARHVARYSQGRWLPLTPSQLGWTDKHQRASVQALAWDSDLRVLFIGGRFDLLNSKPIDPGLAYWNAETEEMHQFSTCSVSWFQRSNDSATINSADGPVVSFLTYDPWTLSLFVGGNFTQMSGQHCPGLAAYHIKDPAREKKSVDECIRTGFWSCLAFDPRFLFAKITAMLYVPTSRTLFVAGRVHENSSWVAPNYLQYTIAKLVLKHDYNQSATSYHDHQHVWEWLPNFEGANDEILSLFFTPWTGEDPDQKKKNKKNDHREKSSVKKSRFRSLFIRELIEDKDDDDSQHLGQSDTHVLETSYSIARPSEYGDLLVGGSFTNYPAVAIWVNRPDKCFTAPVVTDANPVVPGSGVGGITGRITTITPMLIPTQNTPNVNSCSLIVDNNNSVVSPRIIKVQFQQNMSFVWVGISVGFGVVFGATFALFCHSRQSLQRASVQSPLGQGIALQSYGLVPDLDISESYDRAMKARHVSGRVPTSLESWGWGWKAPDSGESLTLINPAEIVLNHIIGEGSFGRVWSAKWKSKSVAVKEFIFAQTAVCSNLDTLALSPDSSDSSGTGYRMGRESRQQIIEEIVGEAGIMSFLRHPRILHLYGCTLTAQAIWIVSELCEVGSLRMLLDEKDLNLSMEERLQMALDVAEGMNYLHSRQPPIIHRDLKSHNLFVQQSVSNSPSSNPKQPAFVVKIGDWGSARAVALSGIRDPKTMTHGIGTVCWLAPEVIRHGKGSERIDVYSFGVVLWELATREEVYAQLSAAQVIARVANEGLRPPLPRACPWASLMQQCWHEDPAARPSFDSVVRSLQQIQQKVMQQQDDKLSDRVVETSKSSSPTFSSSNWLMPDQRNHLHQQPSSSLLPPLITRKATSLSSKIEMKSPFKQKLDLRPDGVPLLVGVSPPPSYGVALEDNDTVPTEMSEARL